MSGVYQTGLPGNNRAGQSLAGALVHSAALPRRAKADLLLICCTFIWGATFVIVKGALNDASVFAFLALRFLVASLALAAAYGRQLRGLGSGGFGAGAVIGCFMFCGYALQTAGLRLTTPAKTAFITGFCVVLVPILAAIHARSRLRAVVWVGALMAFAGLYYLTVPATADGGWATGFRDLNRGDLLVMACTISFTLHILGIGHYAPRYPAGALALLQIATTALLTFIALPLAAATGLEAPRAAFTPGLIAAVLSTGVLATAVAFSVQVWAQQYTTASHAAIIFSLEPVWAAAISRLFYNERLGTRAVAGAALILAGIVLVELKGSGPAAPDSAAGPGGV